jgi:glycine betaine/proline transport system substrate-binding protein
MFKKIILGILAVIGGILTFGSENAYESTLLAGEDNRPPVSLSYVSWDTEIASTNVLGTVLENAGFNVDLVQLDPAIMFSSVASGETDASVSVWAPNTHASYLERYGDQFENLGTHTSGAVTGMVVPEYMDVDSIEDLSNEANQEIIGIEPGAGVVEQTQEAMAHYDNLSDWTLSTSSTGAMLTALSQAIQDEEEIVITGWSPHWIFLEYDMKYLADPDGLYGEGEELQTIVREGFQEDNPIAYQIIDNFNWEPADMEQVMLYIQDDMTPQAAAEKWVEENPEKVAEWTEGIPEE